MFRNFLRGRWLSTVLLVSPVTLVAQRDSATTRIVPIWRGGQLITRVSGDPNVAGAPYVIRIWSFETRSCCHTPTPRMSTPWSSKVPGSSLRASVSIAPRLQPVAVGDYALVPRGHAHFAWSKGMTVIQVHGTGPFRVDFVDSVFVLTGSGAIARFRDTRRPLSPSEVAARFRYRLGDTVAVGQRWGIVREAVASAANGVVQYIIEQPGELPSLHDESELRPRSRIGGP